MKTKTKNNKTVVIISITSDIGKGLAERYSRAGYNIVGTYRTKQLPKEISSLPNTQLFYCDISKKESIAKFANKYKKIGLKWDCFLSCVGVLEPIGKFFNCNFGAWSNSVHVNSVEQLRVLHALYPYRKKGRMADVAFFAGGGVNNPVKNYSAYTISKIMLIKMCEFLDDENNDLNVFILGPGWVKTKLLKQTLAHKKEAEDNYFRTLEFIKSRNGVSIDDIYSCIQWLRKRGKKVASGRNFSVVHDVWSGRKSRKLAKELKSDPNMYKLRRFKNDYLF